jgi:hypothetical protein
MAAPIAVTDALKLDWWAWHRTVGTKDTTIASFWAQQNTAALAFIEKLTSIGGHLLDLAMPAMWTSDLGLEHDPR